MKQGIDTAWKPAWLGALLVLACLVTPVLHAQDQGLPDERSLAWLKSGDYADLDRYLSGLQRDYETGRVSEEELLRGFIGLDQTLAANAADFDRWVAAFPTSYAARTARGDYYYRMAWASRGHEFMRQTSDQQIEGMNRYLALARPDLQAAIGLTAKPYLNTLDLLNMAIMAGSFEERRQWLDLGDKIAPDNAHLRRRYMIGLTPRWGGSYRQMRGFLEECRGQHLPEAQLARLDEVIHLELARAYRDEGGNPAAMYDEWDTVIQLARSAGDDPTPEALIGYSRAAWDLGRRQQADEGLRQLAPMSVEEGWILSQMGWIYTKEGRMSEAWAVLRRAAEHNDAWSELTVGKTLYFGCSDLNLVPDPEAARVWLRRSADHGNPQAKTFVEIDGWSSFLGGWYLRRV
jgi:tetratricopeptide (TPR) repeat protein